MALVLSVARELAAAASRKGNRFPSCIHHLYLLGLCLSLTTPIRAQLPYGRGTPRPDSPGTFDTRELGRSTGIAFIQCTVQDGEGKPVVGATVQINQSNSMNTAGTETKLHGRVSIELPVGFYEIRATYEQLSVS
jgi:hypothetical protein